MFGNWYSQCRHNCSGKVAIVAQAERNLAHPQPLGLRSSPAAQRKATCTTGQFLDLDVAPAHTGFCKIKGLDGGLLCSKSDSQALGGLAFAGGGIRDLVVTEETLSESRAETFHRFAHTPHIHHVEPDTKPCRRRRSDMELGDGVQHGWVNPASRQHWLAWVILPRREIPFIEGVMGFVPCLRERAASARAACICGMRPTGGRRYPCPIDRCLPFASLARRPCT